MLETWEQAKIERLEDRVRDLERKNWERSTRTLQWAMYAYVAVWIAVVAATIATGIAHHGH
ncbi:MAG: hypothetical protein ABW065_11710 [Solirubrobacterales bacterium]